MKYLVVLHTYINTYAANQPIQIQQFHLDTSILNESEGKRVKEEHLHMNWIHETINQYSPSDQCAA